MPRILTFLLTLLLAAIARWVIVNVLWELKQPHRTRT
jgi:hypothetical protein